MRNVQELVRALKLFYICFAFSSGKNTNNEQWEIKKMYFSYSFFPSFFLRT